MLGWWTWRSDGDEVIRDSLERDDAGVRDRAQRCPRHCGTFCGFRILDDRIAASIDDAPEA
jgi:hypothetical protein